MMGVVLQVTGMVTIPGGSWDGDQVLWKLLGVVVQVAGLVKTPGEVGMMTRCCGSCKGSVFR